MDYTIVRREIAAQEIPGSQIIEGIERLPDRLHLELLLYTAVDWNRVDVAIYLIERKDVSVDTIYNDMSMLALALMHDGGTGRYREMIGALVQRCGARTLENRIDMVVPNHPWNGSNVLMLAIATGQPMQVISDILEKMMPIPGPTPLIDAQNDVGRTALHYAAEENNLEAVNLLLQRGANIRLKDRGSNAASHLTTTTAIKTLLGLPPDPSGTPPRRSAATLAAAAAGAGSPPGQVAPKSPSDLLDPQPPPPQGGRRRTRRTRSKRKKTRGRRRS
jgi:hypothetical protein